MAVEEDGSVKVGELSRLDRIELGTKLPSGLYRTTTIGLLRITKEVAYGVVGVHQDRKRMGTLPRKVPGLSNHIARIPLDTIIQPPELTLDVASELNVTKLFIAAETDLMNMSGEWHPHTLTFETASVHEAT